MTLEQARKMVAGTMKGDSAMKEAIKELITGEAVPIEASAASSPAASPGERGTHTLASLKAQQEAW